VSGAGKESAADGGGGFEAGYFAANYRSYAAQNPPKKLAFYRRVIERWAPAERPLSLLDVGCGLGRFLASLPPAEYRAHGTDLSRYAIEHNQERWPHLVLARAAATEQAFPGAAFQVVTAFDVLEHVPDLAAAGEAIAAQLAPGGLLVFVVPVYDGLSGPVIRLLDRDPTHLHKEPRGFWLRWAALRFQVLEWWGVLRYLLPGGFYLHRPTRRLRAHTPAILVAARAPAPRPSAGRAHGPRSRQSRTRPKGGEWR
jgi:SAM-dependent methyltransferase